jgi:hypothetical protein
VGKGRDGGGASRRCPSGGSGPNAGVKGLQR